jgi:hypothetical protein
MLKPVATVKVSCTRLLYCWYILHKSADEWEKIPNGHSSVRLETLKPLRHKELPVHNYYFGIFI